MSDLPPCDFRGAVSADRCRCDCPRVRPGRDGLVPLSLCPICPQRVADGAPIAPPPPPTASAAEPIAVLPCVHRGELLRTELCRRGCPSGREMIPIHACAVRGECSVRPIERNQTLPCCLDCPERADGMPAADASRRP